MGRIFDTLPNKDELETWIMAYSGRDNVTTSRAPASLDYLMRFWEEAKGRYLYKMMGEQFIVETPYEIEQTSEELETAIYESTHYRDGKMSEFFHNYRDWIMYEDHDEDQFFQEHKYSLLRLVENDVLANNLYDGMNMKLIIGDTTIAIQRGCKPVKILGKIANATGIEGFENFRLEHSRVLNQKKLKGYLCLSIHPLDYITMSDNEYGWDSCMNWRSNGCYRMGTVEMMNSPLVVVAYFKGSKTMRFYGGSWNSKKWRNLFIVNDEFITSIKGYPYQSSDLDVACLDMIKDLAEKNLGWRYDDKVHWHEYESHGEGFNLDSETSVYFDFNTNFMYNDFGNGNISAFVLSKDTDNTDFYCEYSGVPECMYCGGIVSSDEIHYPNSDSWVDDSDCLICSDCLHYESCDCCEERIYGDNYYELDDHILCESCYYDHRQYDPLDGEYHYDGDMTTVYLVPSEDDIPKKSDAFYEKHYPYIMVYTSGLKIRNTSIENDRFRFWNETIWYVVEGDTCYSESGFTEEDVIRIFKNYGNFD